MPSRIPYSDGAVGGSIIEIDDIVSNIGLEGDVLQYSAEGEWIAGQVQSSYGIETGQGLTWDAATGKFVNNSVVNGQSTVFSGMDDVNTAAPTDGQILVYSLGKWRPGTVNADGSIAMGVSVIARADSVVISNASNSAGERCVCFGSVNARNGPVTNDMTLLGVDEGRNHAAEGVTAVGIHACLSASKMHATAWGLYSVSIGPQCTAKGTKSIALSAQDSAYNPTGDGGFFINPLNIQPVLGLGDLDTILMYDSSTGRVFRQSRTSYLYSGGGSNNTGVTCLRDVTTDGVYVIDYSQHGNVSSFGDFPIIQIGLFTRDIDAVPMDLIRNTTVSYNHFAVNKQIKVY
eukprot:4330210-Pleurochrysis_carterae.AAC.1